MKGEEGRLANVFHLRQIPPPPGHIQLPPVPRDVDVCTQTSHFSVCVASYGLYCPPVIRFSAVHINTFVVLLGQHTTVHSYITTLVLQHVS